MPPLHSIVFLDLFGGGGSTEIPRQLEHKRHPAYGEITGISLGPLPTEASAGRPLTDCEKCALKAYIPQIDLDNARIHANGVPGYMSPFPIRGFTDNNDIYYRPGGYDPRTPRGLALLGHELYHVGQYRNGMTLWSYILHSESYEKPAYALGNRITDDFLKTGSPC